MKHIKICKPRSIEAKPTEDQKSEGNKVRVVKTNLLSSEGHGCVPTGNIIDRD